MTINICFICLKTFSGSSIPIEDENVSLFVRFAKFAQNYLEISSIESIVKELIDGGCATGRKETFCEKCELSLITPICQIYLQLLSLQLRLAWELGNLGDLLFQSSCDAKSEGMLKSICEQIGISSVSQLDEFRSSLTSKCQLQRNTTLPKIHLERVGDVTIPKPGFETDEFSQLEDSENNEEYPLSPHSDFLTEEAEIKIELERMEDDLCEVDEMSNSVSSIEPIKADDGDKDWNFNISSQKPRNRATAPVKRGREKTAIMEDSAPVPEWQCEMCGEVTLKKAKHLQEHEKNSPEEKRLQCCFCNLSFSIQLCLSEHMKSFHASRLSKDGNFFICEVDECKQEFTTIFDLNSHLKTHSESLHLCPFCGLGFIDEGLQKLHSLHHIKPIYFKKHKKRIWICPDCERKCRSVEELQYHCNIKHGINCKKFNYFKSCSKCGKKFECRSQLHHHHALFHTSKTCSVCGEKLSGSKGLLEHMNLAHKTDFVCPTCGNSLKSECSFKAHMKKHMDKQLRKDKGEDKLKSYKCKTCGKGFTSQKFVYSHTRLVHRKEPHVCAVCGKLYLAKRYLDCHMARYHREHSGPGVKLSYQCVHCPEKFRWKEILYKHLYKAHPDKEVVDGVIECNVCGLRMEKWRSGLMKRHMEKHIPVEERRSQGKMHMCHVCGLEFLAIECYNEHVVNHEENQTESTLRCKICQKPFYYKHKLRDHLITHQKAERQVNNDK